MYAKALICTFLILFFVQARGQSTYSYTNPCTGTINTVPVQPGGVAVTYYGEIRVFQPSDFYTGVFENWAQSVYSSFGSTNPCASVVGLPTGINIAQGTTINFMGIINSLDAIRDVASSATSAASSLPSNSISQSGNGNNQNSNSSGGNSSQSNSTGGTTNGGGGQNSTGSGNAGSAGQPTSQNGQGQGPSGRSTGGGTQESGSTGERSEGGGSTNVVESSVKTTQSQGGEESNGGSNGGGKGGPRNNAPSIVLSSDLAGFNFKDSDVSFGGKFNGGYTALRWDGARSYGVVADYTTSLRGPNISGFYAFVKDKRIDILSCAATIGFDTKFTAYATVSGGQMWNLGKNKKAKALYMLTASIGKVYQERFLGTATILGGMYDFKVGKRIEMKVMGLYVYAPYVVYYTDILLKSPHVILPVVGTNIGITKKFKININFGGAYAMNEDVLNYTVMMGSRLAL